MSNSSGTVSWHYITASILAGVGLGYLIGVISGKGLWRERRRQGRGQPSSSSAPSGAAIISALGELTSEVGRLKEAIESGGPRLNFPPVPRSMRTADSSEFVSAFEDSDGSGDEFFEATTANDEEDSEASPYSEFDKLGKRTLESEEVCVSLIQQLKSRLEKTPEDVECLWRLSRVLHHLSIHHQGREEKEREKELLEEAAEHAQKALELDDKCWQAHQWYSGAIGALSLFEGTQQKITRGYEFKEHVDTAISLKPDSPALHYMLGRWCMNVAKLSWLEKKAAAALYATPPESTYDEALQCFMKAEALEPGKWKSNVLHVAKCHIQLGNIDEAVQWLQKAYNIPTLNSDDISAHSEVQDLLNQYDSDFFE